MPAIQIAVPQRNIQMFSSKNIRNVPQMAATSVQIGKLYMETEEAQQRQGMDSFPIAIYNSLLQYCLENKEYRNAMLFICMANWGMRFSDVVRVRFCHLFDSDGNFKDNFTLPNGEQKTKKKNIYYNNEATWRIILLYLDENRCTPYDYLFTSDSNNAPTISLTDIEREEKFGNKIRIAEKNIHQLEKQKADLLKLYSHGTISEAEFTQLNEQTKNDMDNCIKELSALKTQMENYVSSTENADRIMIRKNISYVAAQNMIKSTLEKIGVNARNRTDKAICMNCDLKLNTHSLRKTFAEEFVQTGTRLNAEGKLSVDATVLNLLQHKFMHSSMSTTNRYSGAEEEAFLTICKSMNIGLDILSQYD